jgi:hypothetical protein
MVVRMLSARKADKPVAGIRAGTVAIWDAGPAGTDYAPAIDPLSHLSKVRFHSDFDYLRIKSVVRSTDPGRAPVSLAAINIYDYQLSWYPLFDHGLAHTPIIVAEISYGGYNQPIAGSAFIFKANWEWTGRYVGFAADATTVYMLVRGNRADAAVLNWKVFVLEDSFQSSTAASRLLRFEVGKASIGALGKIDPTYQFIRKAAGASGDLRILGRPSLVFDTQNGITCLNYCDGENETSLPMAANFFPTANYHFDGIECDVISAAPDGQDAGFSKGANGIRIRDAAGNVVFSSEWQMLAVLKQLTGSVTTSLHVPTGNLPMRAREDFDVGAAPYRTQALIGWIKGSDGLAFDFSGTFISGNSVYRRGPAWATVWPYCQMFSPVINASRVLIRDDWFSIADNTGAYQGAPKWTLQPKTIFYDIRCVALIGGA